MRQRMRKPQCRFDPLLLVNAAHPLPKVPWPDLTAVDECYPDVLLERRVAGLLRACIQAVGGQGQIVPVSGWRSQAEQQSIWDDCLIKSGETFTRKYVALPGCSEHQTGLAIDLGLAAEKLTSSAPTFPRTASAAPSAAVPPILALCSGYPAGKEAVTGIAHEPWHFRYVGVPHARLMTEMGLTLEEYVAWLRECHSQAPLRRRLGLYEFSVQYHSGTTAAGAARVWLQPAIQGQLRRLDRHHLEVRPCTFGKSWWTGPKETISGGSGGSTGGGSASEASFFGTL